MGPVACLIHVDVVPRRAVRKVGPRSDLSRSTHIGEPCGPARLLGDGSRSSCSPYRATHQSTGGGRMKNGGSNPPAPGSRCAGAPGRRVPSRGLRVYFHPMMATLPLAALGASLGLWAYGTYEPNSPLFGRVIGRGPGAGRVAYLTFDDGPNPGATEPILDTLAGLGVPAGFFMVGEHVRRFPGIARRVVAAGHEVGNHTLRHPKLHFRGPRRIDAELTGAHAVIANATGRAPRSFRAPHGYRNPFVTRSARRLGYTVFGWTFGVWDSDPRVSAAEIRRRVARKLRPGAIILLRDGDGYDPASDRFRRAAAVARGIVAVAVVKENDGPGS